MRIKPPIHKFSLGKSCYSGETIGDRHITIYLRQCWSIRDIVECIKHEDYHALLGQSAQTTAKQDHYIMKYLDVETF